MSTAYALGIRDRTGPIQYLRRGAFIGNLMSTTSPFDAWTWQTDADLEHWWAGLPEDVKDQLADRKLLVVPLTIAVGTPEHTLTWKTVEPPPRLDGTAPAETPKRTLNTSQLLFGE